ncbi:MULTISPECIES: HAD family hydrolase [Micrococcaceae]|uniref:HAD family hydrolase n=1 Tax=Micrococcaceae TaxID=1268 RepID=UPI00181F0660|nr:MULTISPECIES: HAD family hydrolase [Micrococcaceae]MBB5748945.1 HAD superfamily hydrolase (TIGR01509 family) [Micrococcus sp. TA1]HRO92858.1 HAD family hydrolase [Citricoccus sp.]
MSTPDEAAGRRRPDAMPAAVFWDMDGTIVDTEPLWNESQRRLVKEAGGTWTHALAQSLVGQALDHGARLLQQAGVRLGVEEIIGHTMGDVIDGIKRSVPWRPGARELLAALRAAGVPSALVTMSHAPLAGVVAAAMPAGSFEFLVTGDMVLRGKPHPEPYATAFDVMARRVDGLQRPRCVAIEDSLPGLESAAAAGLPVVAVPHVMPLPADPRWEHWTSLAGRLPADLGRVARQMAGGPDRPLAPVAGGPHGSTP